METHIIESKVGDIISVKKRRAEVVSFTVEKLEYGNKYKLPCDEGWVKIIEYKWIKNEDNKRKKQLTFFIPIDEGWMKFVEYENVEE